ncbi:hypothetical protein [Streptomyces sp. NPDC057682]|uniref:hypothetical protein n=1 Tax=unclassified Streptomyces TaxID=2593676 RepID=UPI00365C4C23
MESLTSQQLRGTACVRCSAQLTATTAVDLGARPERDGSSVQIFPRRCRSCPEEAPVDTRTPHEHTAPAQG